MAGLQHGTFIEKLSPHLRRLLAETLEAHGVDSPAYRALHRQFVYSPQEAEVQPEVNSKHFEARLPAAAGLPRGVERLYRRQLVVDLTMVCAAHCRYCLRANYESVQLDRRDIDAIAAHASRDPDLKEVLVTGGDPFMVPKLLKHLIAQLVERAPNVRVIRMGTRLPVQSPDTFNEDLYTFFNAYAQSVMLEVGVQVNHPIELHPLTLTLLRRLQDSRVRVYSQNVLLKGVNDDAETLAELYDTLRYLGCEAHYLFHSVPMRGTHHLRTSVAKGLALIGALTASGAISGRAKPQYALMTDVGKVVLYQGSILRKDEKGFLHVDTHYTLKDRRRWNPHYRLPENSVRIAEDGHLIVKYLDGQ